MATFGERTMVSSILKRAQALTACGRWAGMSTVSPARATTGAPPMVSSTSPSSTSTRASKGEVLGELLPGLEGEERHHGAGCVVEQLNEPHRLGLTSRCVRHYKLANTC